MLKNLITLSFYTNYNDYISKVSLIIKVYYFFICILINFYTF